MPPTVSRRRFLVLGSAAGVTALLGGCQDAPAAGDFGGRAMTPRPLPSSFPSIAGPITLGEASTITVDAPAGARTLPYSEPVALYGVDGSGLKQIPPDAGMLAWLRGEADQEEQITALQQLPPLAATGDIPAELATQPPATGETRPIGPLTLITRDGWGAAPPQVTTKHPVD